MVKYDPRILQKFATSLYRRATVALVVCTVIGVLVGVMYGLGFGVHFAAAMGRGELWPVFAGIVTICGGVIGWLIGNAIAFQYRLRAQITLCQHQIELNTRPKAHQPAQDQKALASLIAADANE